METSTVDPPPLVHTVVPSPVGNLLLAASRHGLALLAFDGERIATELEEEGLSAPQKKSGESPDHPGSATLSTAGRQLSEYFDRKRQHFALVLDLRPEFEGYEGVAVPNPWVSRSGGFRTRAQVSLQTIPYGTTASYGEVAEYLGSPRAARAVGTACSSNPLPIILPCHRVTGADGTLGKYTGGRSIKEKLLSLERGQL